MARTPTYRWYREPNGAGLLARGLGPGTHCPVWSDPDGRQTASYKLQAREAAMAVLLTLDVAPKQTPSRTRQD